LIADLNDNYKKLWFCNLKKMCTVVQKWCCTSPHPETHFFALNVHVYCLIKCTAFAFTCPASRPQQWACVHIYADAVLPVQYIGTPLPVVD